MPPIPHEPVSNPARPLLAYHDAAHPMSPSSDAHVDLILAPHSCSRSSATPGLSRLKGERQDLRQQLEANAKARPVPLTIDPDRARGFFLGLKRAYQEGTNEQKPILFRTYIRRMELGPETGEITVVFYPHYLQENMKRDM